MINSKNRCIYSKHFTEFEKIPPMVIGIWYGESKPILNEYLASFVAELEDVLSNGIVVNDNFVKVKFGRVHSDTPARCFLKGKNYQNS